MAGPMACSEAASLKHQGVMTSTAILRGHCFSGLTGNLCESRSMNAEFVNGKSNSPSLTSSVRLFGFFDDSRENES
jgi:hypothetical protein